MISFIIPAHDEARLIAATLASIHDAARACSVPCERMPCERMPYESMPYEIVVVDDDSSDGTAAIAESNGARVVAVQYRHIAATRNAGAKAAVGETLVFVDADTTIDAAVLAAALARLRDGAVGGGAAVQLQGEASWREGFLIWLLIHVFRLTRVAPGCFIFCTRAAFDACGGFDESWFAGEDIAISRALARQGRFVILREPVWTSDRKLRTFSMRDHLRLAWTFLLHGRRILQSREHLKLWYDRRRHGPK